MRLPSDALFIEPFPEGSALQCLGTEAEHVPVYIEYVQLAGTPREVFRAVTDPRTAVPKFLEEVVGVADREPHPGARMSLTALT